MQMYNPNQQPNSPQISLDEGWLRWAILDLAYQVSVYNTQVDTIKRQANLIDRDTDLEPAEDIVPNDVFKP
jgi:hypothetical protein